MREIIFRGKSRVGNNWKYGYLTKTCEDSGDKYWIDVSNKDWNDSYEIDPDTVGQYTGLTDKNGKKIFEGDIVKGTISSAWGKKEIICEVRFINDGYYCVEIRQDNIYQHKLMFSKKLEIVGNIWDNPELIKENEDD